MQSFDIFHKMQKIDSKSMNLVGSLSLCMCVCFRWARKLLD